MYPNRYPIERTIRSTHCGCAHTGLPGKHNVIPCTRHGRTGLRSTHCAGASTNAGNASGSGNGSGCPSSPTGTNGLILRLRYARVTTGSFSRRHISCSVGTPRTAAIDAP